MTTTAPAPTAAPAAPRQRRAGSRVGVVTAVTLVLLVAGVLASGALGQLATSVGDVLGSLLAGVGIDTSLRPDREIVERALWQIRFPRVAMAIMVGAGLALAGAVMQAIFGNPLAEPGVVGVSAGAAFGGALAITLGLGAAWTLPLYAFVGGLAATLVVYVTARAGGRTEVVTLLLTGIAVQAVAMAGLALVVFTADTASREQIIFWQLGSLNGSSWGEVAVVAPIVALGAVVAVSRSRGYDLLALGERTAEHLGVRVELLRAISVVLVALVTGAAVAFAGIISFVGLVVPHLVRMIVGPSHRALIPLSILGGATLMVWADLAARTIVAGGDLPIGMLTALIGGPFFFWMVRRTRRTSGGWA